jgi:hypothetical protein
VSFLYFDALYCKGIEMSDELNDAVVENATGPKRVTDDQGTVEQHSIPDTIAAAKFDAAKVGLANKTLGLRRVKMEPPGTV